MDSVESPETQDDVQTAPPRVRPAQNLANLLMRGLRFETGYAALVPLGAACLATYMPTVGVRDPRHRPVGRPARLSRLDTQTVQPGHRSPASGRVRRAGAGVKMTKTPYRSGSPTPALRGPVGRLRSAKTFHRHSWSSPGGARFMGTSCARPKRRHCEARPDRPCRRRSCRRWRTFLRSTHSWGLA